MVDISSLVHLAVVGNLDQLCNNKNTCIYQDDQPLGGPKDDTLTMWGPRLIAKLVHITPITMVYGTYN